jgi:hypothetical protein
MSVFNYPQCRVSLIAYSNTHSRIKLKTSVHMKVVSERLGHNSPAFTMTVYQHVTPGMQTDAAGCSAKPCTERSRWLPARLERRDREPSRLRVAGTGEPPLEHTNDELVELRGRNLLPDMAPDPRLLIRTLHGLPTDPMFRPEPFRHLHCRRRRQADGGAQGGRCSVRQPRRHHVLKITGCQQQGGVGRHVRW